MKYMLTYDFMETIRNANQWLGASVHALGSYPAMSLFPNPAAEWMKAWGEVTERTFARMVVKPDWNLPTFTGPNGNDRTARAEVVVARPFGDLLHFKVEGRREKARRVLLVAPMSGHYATLLRSTVISLLPDCEVFITDW
ncbi:MAG: polyhydroxyalkanoate depolymerase, partial [Paracoccaceae bacterium]|nr:polyhydroxyalkanoate depolymerase [Paracoccaceae bacterium]